MKAKFTVIERYKDCAVHDSDGKHILAKATQSELKKLYETGHQDKIKRSEQEKK